jgi:hypothetical protein
MWFRLIFDYRTAITGLLLLHTIIHGRSDPHLPTSTKDGQMAGAR